MRLARGGPLNARWSCLRGQDTTTGERRTAELAEPFFRVLDVAEHEHDRELDAVLVAVRRQVEADHHAFLLPLRGGERSLHRGLTTHQP